MAEQARLAIGGAFAEQMEPDYLDTSAVNPDYAGLDHFGEWYALGAFAETADEAARVYEEHSATWQATIEAVAAVAVQQQVELALRHSLAEITQEDEDEDNNVLAFKPRERKQAGAGLLALFFDPKAA
jgi:hypothetical protein